MRSRSTSGGSRAAGLIQAAKDIRGNSRLESDMIRANIRHKELFQLYLEELIYAKDWADSWWKSIIQTEFERIGDSTLAKRNVARQIPGGAATHGGNIAVIRKYWLACIALNRELAQADVVQPEDFLLGWLIQASHFDLAEFVSELPYWPIGMDNDGEWV